VNSSPDLSMSRLFKAGDVEAMPGDVWFRGHLRNGLADMAFVHTMLHQFLRTTAWGAGACYCAAFIQGRCLNPYLHPISQSVCTMTLTLSS